MEDSEAPSNNAASYCNPPVAGSLWRLLQLFSSVLRPKQSQVSSSLMTRRSFPVDSTAPLEETTAHNSEYFTPKFPFGCFLILLLTLCCFLSHPGPPSTLCSLQKVSVLFRAVSHLPKYFSQSSCLRAYGCCPSYVQWTGCIKSTSLCIFFQFHVRWHCVGS